MHEPAERTTRSDPGSPGRPLPVRLALWLLRLSASLGLAVVLISVLAVVLAWATIVEHCYGTPVARFGFYRAPWFLLLGGLVALNLAAAAVVRLPWRRHHAGFLLTHLGILVLLAGGLVNYLGGIRSQLPVFEGNSARRAYQETQHFAIEVQPLPTDEAEIDADIETTNVSFDGGPFHWQDYGQMFWFPWRLAGRDRGIVYDRDGVSLEVLDYLSDSRLLPQITLDVDPDPGGDGGPSAAAPQQMTLAVVSDGPQAAKRPWGLGQQRAAPRDYRIAFWMAGSRAETEAFLDSRPEGSLGNLGQVVLWAGGDTFRFRVDDLLHRPRQPLGTTGLEVGLLAAPNATLAVQLAVHCPGDPPQPMALFATAPYMNFQDDLHGVYGSYWLDPQALPAAADRAAYARRFLHEADQPRIDIIQGYDRLLYYRTWRPSRIGTIGPWPLGDSEAHRATGPRIVAFEESDRPIALTLVEFLPRGEQDAGILPRSRGNGTPRPRVRLRLSVDERSEESWLAAMTDRLLPDQRLEVTSHSRRVSISLVQDYIDLGFQVHLRKFSRNLDPGSGTGPHYSSLVDFCDVADEQKQLEKGVLISLNAPVDFRDPVTGRSYRLYQSDYDGPFSPDDPQFRQAVGAAEIRDYVYQSKLAVNSDPGRGLKYVGCLIIAVGIWVSFYLRRYFARAAMEKAEKQ